MLNEQQNHSYSDSMTKINNNPTIKSILFYGKQRQVREQRHIIYKADETLDEDNIPSCSGLEPERGEHEIPFSQFLNISVHF